MSRCEVEDGWVGGDLCAACWCEGAGTAAFGSGWVGFHVGILVEVVEVLYILPL